MKGLLDVYRTVLKGVVTNYGEGGGGGYKTGGGGGGASKVLPL